MKNNSNNNKDDLSKNSHNFKIHSLTIIKTDKNKINKEGLNEKMVNIILEK